MGTITLPKSAKHDNNAHEPSMRNMNLNKGSKGKADKENTEDQMDKHLSDDAIIQEESPIKRIKPNSSVMVDPDFDTLEPATRNFTKSDAKGGKVDNASPQVAVK